MHGDTTCHRETSVCFNCDQKGHLIWNCPLKKDSQVQNFEWGKSKPNAQGRGFTMTYQDAQASSDVVIGIVQFHSQSTKVLFYPRVLILYFCIICWSFESGYWFVNVWYVYFHTSWDVIFGY